MIIDFLSTTILWLALWTLREFERRRVFMALAEQIETLDAGNRRLREENHALRDREQKHLQMIATARDSAREFLDKIDLGGNASLPAPAEYFDGQHTSIRVTSRLNGAGKSAVGSSR
jgi:hypothetical protein